MSALLTASHLAYETVRWAGVAYLAWIGGRMLVSAAAACSVRTLRIHPTGRDLHGRLASRSDVHLLTPTTTTYAWTLNAVGGVPAGTKYRVIVQAVNAAGAGTGRGVNVLAR
ncbi:hypothetical protein AB0M54_37150 [Actinoplanes sp. NPDC051470]|uniref:hypothetical protein n=1 Tax=Actinoplanes sp. NPDC051470 TaxID=3157224 RepID=UPI00342D0CD8